MLISLKLKKIPVILVIPSCFESCITCISSNILRQNYASKDKDLGKNLSTFHFLKFSESESMMGSKLQKTDVAWKEQEMVKKNQKCMIYLIKHASLYKHICQVLQSYYSLLCSKEVMQEEALYRCKRYMHFWKYDKLNKKKIYVT